jgi:hypothetical protein
MMLLYILGALLIVSIIIKKKTYNFDFDFDLDFGLEIFIGIIAMFLVLGLISIPLNHARERSNIVQYHSVKATIEQARNSENIERAALALKIAETNEWLAKSAVLE